MPYGSTAELPTAVKDKIKSKKRRRQWLHVFNSALQRHGDESRAFAEAWAAAKRSGGVAKRLKISKDEAGYKGQTIDSEHCSVCTMFRAPDGCTLVKGEIRPQGWCKFFERAKGASGKVAKMANGKFTLFLPLAKVNKEKRTVSGYASTPTRDMDGEIVTLDAVKAALPDYMRWGNIREMHRLSAVGTAEEAHTDGKGLFLTAKIVDDNAWKKCLEGVYKGFSIGGRKLDKVGEEVTEIEMVEISIVDRPANPDCRINVVKSAKAGEAVEAILAKPEKLDKDETAKALKKASKILKQLAKAGPPAAHDGFSLPAKPVETDKTVQNRSPNDPEEQVNKGGDKPGDGSKPYGDVEYADPGYQADKKKRYPVDTEEHIRAAWNYIHKKKNAAKYTPEQVSSMKSKIASAWKAKVDKDGPPAMESKKQRKLAKKLAKAAAKRALANFDLRKAPAEDRPKQLDLDEPPLELGEPTDDDELGAPDGDEDEPMLPFDDGRSLSGETDGEVLLKSMGAARDLSCAFDLLRSVQRSLLYEGNREGGDGKDKALAKRVGACAKELAGIIGQKAEHEGEEATTLTDADDSGVRQLLGEDFAMTDQLDDLSKTILMMVKRAAEPTRVQRIEKAREALKMAKAARSEAADAIEKLHKSIKAAYLAKLAKAGKKDKGEKDDDDEFDHADAMGKLQKAFGALEKTGTFMKAARQELKKAVTRAGERGQETADGDGKFYTVPPGVRDITPNEMATASPSGTGSMPPAYPGDGSTYPGKTAGKEGLDLRKFARNGMVPAELVDLATTNARLSGEVEALRRIPLGQVRGRPFAFDMTKTFGGNGQTAEDTRERNAALFQGVDPAALASDDEGTRNRATATVAGNYILSSHFGKSAIFDPDFHGTAGLKS